MANKTQMCIMQTTDYSEVKHINGNRIVNPRNVELIKESMSKEQLIVPAILNEHMQIIDGQHRLEACKELSLPFYYIVIDGYSLQQVQMINANMKNWTRTDFLDSFLDLYKLGNTQYKNYVELKDFIDTTGLDLTTTIALSNTDATRKSLDETFKQGGFSFSNIDKLLDLASALKEFQIYNDKKWKMVTFAKTFSMLYYYPNYDHARMMRNMTKNFHLLELMGNERSTRQYLLEVYNFNNRAKNKIYETALIDFWSDGGEDENVKG